MFSKKFSCINSMFEIVDKSMEKKINLEKIKLIIWDLDDTFWKGTFSEENVEIIEDNCQLVKTLSERGIVNSICSKNDEEPVKEYLSIIGMLDYFVFISVNWEPKGKRISHMLNNMGLRAENALFIDDNQANLQEAEYYNSGIMTATPDIAVYLLSQVDKMGKEDVSRTRLQQYKLLENKIEEKNSFSSNEEFLKESNIRIAIFKKCNDEIDRIYEMIHRTNQLNFTKNRISKEELERLFISEKFDCGYIKATDKFGEYGIVGFFCVNIEEKRLVHFLFSCRTMGMGIEQYVYELLGCPQIEIVPPISGEISRNEKKIDYITLVEDVKEQNKKDTSCKILLKGPCDLEILASYLKNNGDIDTEFNFVDEKGQQADYYNHLIQIRNTLMMKKVDITKLVQKYDFFSEAAFRTKLFSGDYDIVCLSVLMDATLGVYKNRENDSLIPYGLYSKSLVDSMYWSEYIEKKVMTARSEISKEQLQLFSEEYEKIDYTAELFGDNLEWVINKILEKNKNTKIVLLLLSELPYTIEMKNNKALIGKEKIHVSFNKEMIRRFEDNKNVRFIYVNEMIQSQEDYFDNINHYSKLVYYRMAQEFTNILKEWNIDNIQIASKWKAIVDNIIRMYVKIKFWLLKDRL